MVQTGALCESAEILKSLRKSLLGYEYNDLKKLVPGLPVLGKAFLAINRSSLSGLERYFAIFTTV